MQAQARIYDEEDLEPNHDDCNEEAKISTNFSDHGTAFAFKKRKGSEDCSNQHRDVASHSFGDKCARLDLSKNVGVCL